MARAVKTRPVSPGRHQAGDHGPNSDLARYTPAALPVKPRDSRPAKPNVAKPERWMATPSLPGRAPQSPRVSATNKNNRPRRFVAQDGTQIGTPGKTGSPVRRRS